MKGNKRIQEKAKPIISDKKILKHFKGKQMKESHMSHL